MIIVYKLLKKRKKISPSSVDLKIYNEEKDKYCVQGSGMLVKCIVIHQHSRRELWKMASVNIKRAQHHRNVLFS